MLVGVGGGSQGSPLCIKQRVYRLSSCNLSLVLQILDPLYINSELLELISEYKFLVSVSLMLVARLKDMTHHVSMKASHAQSIDHLQYNIS